ncbi:MAG: hypothetical protein V2A79_14460 [Planctomycetota bacterium]
MWRAIDPLEIAKTNPAVDAKKIEEAFAIRRFLEQAGVFKKPDYHLSPPLGDTPEKPTSMGPRVVRMTRSG